MVKHWRMLLLPGFSDCSWAECDVDRSRLMATGNVLKRASLYLEGSFRALYVPLGGSKTRIENTPYNSIKFYISMFSDKPPCMPLYFGTAVIIPLEAAEAFSSFLASSAVTFFFISLYSNGFFLFLGLCGRGLFFIFFFLLSLLLPLLFLS